MHVFKFGGASLKTARAVKNMIEIVCNTASRRLVVIVSAMGKTTNSLESILMKVLDGGSYQQKLDLLEKYHFEIYTGLGLDNWGKDILPIFENLKTDLESIEKFEGPDKAYDQIVSYGELLSSKIIYLALSKDFESDSHLVDARTCIKTNDRFKEAKVNWEESNKAINDLCGGLLANGIVLSQGFIGSSLVRNKTTTLGREGSDFTAAIFATAMNAKDVTFWKDVPGIMTADPKLDKTAQQFLKLPYQEAAEMTYYGAKVIHPKTIRPLANKHIPLIVRSFNETSLPGTIISTFDEWVPMPASIIKPNQCLITIKFSDFHFVNDAILHKVNSSLRSLNIGINLMQNSAISISICFDYHENKLKSLLSILNQDFDTYYNTDLSLLTIKNYNPETLEGRKPEEEILLEQQTRANYRAVYRSN